ncbi:MAG: hypothetical protein INR73_11180 [Williamsia sp.]|nr:hypothetical protein [Williamsia sp.]
MAEISKESRILLLESQLHALLGNFGAIRSLFADHVESGFTETFLAGELAKLAEDPDHILRNVIGQTNINVINSSYVDYSIQLRGPFQRTGNQVKWMGISQVVSIKGPGSMRVRVLEVPEELDINYFQPGIHYTVVEERRLHQGDFISASKPSFLLDVVEISGVVVIEILTIKDPDADIFWNFDDEGKSYMAEAAKVTMSRLVNMLNVAAVIGTAVPGSLYESIFAWGDATVRLKAIQTMLTEGNFAAFDRLQEAIDSSDHTLSDGAQRILDRLVDAKS